MNASSAFEVSSNQFAFLLRNTAVYETHLNIHYLGYQFGVHKLEIISVSLSLAYLVYYIMQITDCIVHFPPRIIFAIYQLALAQLNLPA